MCTGHEHIISRKPPIVNRFPETDFSTISEVGDIVIDMGGQYGDTELTFTSGSRSFAAIPGSGVAEVMVMWMIFARATELLCEAWNPAAHLGQHANAGRPCRESGPLRGLSRVAHRLHDNGIAPDDTRRQQQQT